MCPTRNLLEDFGTEAASRREAPSFVQTALNVSAHRYDDERLVPDVFNRLTRGSGGTNSAQVRLATAERPVGDDASFFLVPGAQPEHPPSSSHRVLVRNSTGRQERGRLATVNDSSIEPCQDPGASSTTHFQPPSAAPCRTQPPGADFPHGQQYITAPTASHSSISFTCPSFVPVPNMMGLGPWQPLHALPSTGFLPMGVGVHMQAAPNTIPYPQQQIQLLRNQGAFQAPAAPQACAHGRATAIADHDRSHVPLDGPTSTPSSLSDCTHYLPLGLRSHIAMRIKASSGHRQECLERFRKKKIQSMAAKAGPRYMSRKKRAEQRARVGGRFVRTEGPQGDGRATEQGSRAGQGSTRADASAAPSTSDPAVASDHAAPT